MNRTYIILAFISLMLFGCGSDFLPKPKAMLKLEYAKGDYQHTATNCPYDFDHNELSNVTITENCNIRLDYPFMKGAIYLTYKPVNENLEALLRDAQKLTYEHTIKADNIIEQPFVKSPDKVYGMFYEVGGNAASQSQFYLTDSTNHFVTGSLYFYAKPNYDSILPAAEYLKKDIRKIMESLNWKK